MKKRSQDWDFDDEAIVGAFDVLGFKRIMCDWNSIQDVAHRITRLISHIEEVAEERTSFEFNGVYSEAKLKVAQASDTFVVYSSYASPADLIQFLWNVQQLLFYSIRERFPLRGAISIGQVAANPTEHLFLGPAIVSALQLERVADWAGALIDEPLEKKLSVLGLLPQLEPLLIRHQPPYKPKFAASHPIKPLCLNWLADAPNYINSKFIQGYFPEVTTEDEEYESVQRKIENTRAFMVHADQLERFTGPNNRRIELTHIEGIGRVIRFVLDNKYSEEPSE